MNPIPTHPNTHPSVATTAIDGDLAEQALPGHGVPSQDPSPAAQQALAANGAVPAPLPPLLILHGDADHVVSVRNAAATAEIVGQVAERLAWAGVDLDPVRNFRNETVVSRDASAVTVLVEPANEELPIAEAVRRLLGAGEGVST